MPSYAYLFKSQRGDDLLAYVASLKSPDSQQHLQQKIAEWKPSAQSAMEAKRLNGKNLFNEYCATCHEPDGKVLQQWHADFQVLPAVLTTARLHSVPEDATFDQQQNAIAKIIKFGMPGTDMAGHEYLADAQVDAIAEWVMKMRASNGNHERGRTR